MSLTLYNKPECPFCWKVRLVAAFGGLTLELKNIDTRHKPDAFLVLNPSGTVPVLDDAGKIVCGSEEIIQYWAPYLASKSSLDLESEAAWQWHTYANAVLGNGTKQWVFQHRDRPADELDQKLMNQCKAKWLSCLVLIESEFPLGARWLMGDAPSIADCALFPRIALGLRYGLPSLKAYPKLHQWYDQLAHSDMGVQASAWRPK